MAPTVRRFLPNRYRFTHWCLRASRFLSRLASVRWSWLLVLALGSWSWSWLLVLALGSWLLALGSWLLALGSWLLVVYEFWWSVGRSELGRGAAIAHFIGRLSEQQPSCRPAVRSGHRSHTVGQRHPPGQRPSAKSRSPMRVGTRSGMDLRGYGRGASGLDDVAHGSSLARPMGRCL